ncbi:XdhC family protein [Oceanicella sp. SM1341]|uniref:XdhC family protein n=1 Tax=Oceanicella sp. SM1341 TaxID=1548889 RepID=UPI000E468ED6|nr:XdhC family protein [Oceanicella sp. SM1341]
MTADHDSMPEIALDWVRAGKGVALATVIETWGSAPRPVGSQLVISGEAEIMGSVSGGCVEGAVVAEALDALEDGTPRVLTYGVSDDDAFAVGLACGGTIRVMVEPVGVGQGFPVEMLEALVAARAARRATVCAVNTETWERRLIGAGPDALIAEADAARHADRSGFAGAWFLGVHNPPLRMVVVGAVHIAQPLLQMARVAGYDATLVDPREAFAADARFPGETILRDWPDEALRGLGVDARTAVVTLTHDPKLDDPAIRVALASECFYLGCLGSTRTHAKRLDRLGAEGVSAEALARIHAPVGADIGAKSPAEIAVSILAQITERLRRPATRPGVAASAA